MTIDLTVCLFNVLNLYFATHFIQAMLNCLTIATVLELAQIYLGQFCILSVKLMKL